MGETQGSEDCGKREAPPASLQVVGGRGKLDHPCHSMDLEDAATIFAVVGNVKFLSQPIERENVGNPPGVKVDWCIAKIRLESCVQCAFVAVDANRMSHGTNIVDMILMGEKMNCRLAVK